MIKKRKILSFVTAAVLCFSMSSAAFADDIDGQGAIHPTSAAINVALPANFYWYADSSTYNAVTTYFDIVSGTYSITNNSLSANLAVSLTAYGATAGATNSFTAGLENDITLNLTGALAAGGLGQDLFNYTTSPFGTYSTALRGMNAMSSTTAGETWTFGFNGSYNQSTLPAAELADYTITLTFSVDSFS